MADVDVDVRLAARGLSAPCTLMRHEGLAAAFRTVAFLSNLVFRPMFGDPAKDSLSDHGRVPILGPRSMSEMISPWSLLS